MKRLWIAAIVIIAARAETAPKVTVPRTYHQQQGAAGTSTDPAVGNWWATFNDPELTSLVERAIQANLDLKIASSRVLEARAARRIARGDLLPTVGVSGSAQDVRGGLTSGLRAPFESGVYQSGFDSSWELDLFGGKRKALEAATADAAAVAEARRDTLVTLLAEVARNYSEVRGYQRRSEITRENIKLQEESLDLTRVRAEAGIGAELDVERQAALLESTRALLPALEAAEFQAIHRLSVLMGDEPGTLLAQLTRSKPLPAAPPVVPVGLPSDLLKRRPDIREAEARVAAETARVGVAHADLFPKISLTGAFGRQGTDVSGFTLGAGNFFAFGPSISLPIFTSGKLRARVEAQKQRLDATVTEYRGVVLRSLEETENSLVAYGHEQDRREKLVRAADASRQTTVLANELYTRGLADFLSVLDAQRQQLAVEDDLVRSDTAVITDLITLYKALGGGWESFPRE